MIYIIAIIFPPLGTMFAGLFGQTLVSLFLFTIGIMSMGTLYVLCPIHACVVIAGARQKKRHEETMRAVRSNHRHPQ